MIQAFSQRDDYTQAETYFAKGISHTFLVIEPDITAYRGFTHLNFVAIRSEPNAIQPILKKIEIFFEGINSFEIVIPEGFCIPSMIGEMQQLGYHQTDQSVSMILDLFSFKIKAPIVEEGLHIQSSDTQLQEWMLPLVEAFESTREMCLIYAKAHETALDKGFHFQHYTLYRHNCPVASITLSYQHQCVRIDDVATVPAFQGRGYATRLVNFALSQAKKLGAHSAFLEASDSGLSLYQKIGFQPLFTNKIYSRLNNEKEILSYDGVH